MNELDNCFRKGLLRKVEPSKIKAHNRKKIEG